MNFFSSSNKDNSPYQDITSYINSVLSTQIFTQGKAQTESVVILGSLLPTQAQFNMIQSKYNQSLSIGSTQSSNANSLNTPNTSQSITKQINAQ